jgi:uncharacterized membrane protein YfcA
MDILHLILIFLAGIVVGFINVLAAGGSFLTLAFLIALGLPPTVANGTNRVGLLIQNSFASLKFYKLKLLNYKFVFIVAPSALIGSLIGSYIATHISDELLKKIIAILMVAISLVTVYKPQKFIKKSYSKKKWLLMIAVFFLIGVYGGFIQAGVGFFIIAASIWGGFSMVEANAIKVFTITIYTITILPMFIFAHQVYFLIGIVLGLGSMIGARIAIGVSIKKGDKFIRAAILILLFAFAIKLMFF